MSVTQHSEFFSLKADVDLTSYLDCFIKRTGPETCTVATAASDDIIGVLCNKPRAGETASVQRIMGGATFRVKAGATLAAAALVTAGAGGKAVAATSGQRGVARLTQSAVNNDVVEAEGADAVV